MNIKRVRNKHLAATASTVKQNQKRLSNYYRQHFAHLTGASTGAQNGLDKTKTWSMPLCRVRPEHLIATNGGIRAQTVRASVRA